MSNSGVLEDIRPPNGGEYFHVLWINANGDSGAPVCFICGKSLGRFHGTHMQAIAQCTDSAVRILRMFSKVQRHYFGSSYNGVRLTVSSCLEHSPYLRLLEHETGDGIITKERVNRAEWAIISREHLDELISTRAHELYLIFQHSRAHENWCDAWNRFLKEHGRIPSRAEQVAWAEALYNERKDENAVRDWLQAEKELLEKYRLA